jgi:glycosyltransferase involved in cell wall biosynthesis
MLDRQRKMFAELKNSHLIGDYELVFINDGSRDKSEELLRAEVSKGDVVLVNMSRNFGVSECVLAGMEHSTGDAVVYMDADLQDPPELIPDMVRAWINDPEAEVVYTTRTRRAGEHPLKMLVTKFGYRFIASISYFHLPVDSGDFKLLSRRAVNYLLELKEDRPYMRGLVGFIGFKQIPVFYDRDARFDGRHNTKNPVLSKRVLYYWLERPLIAFSDIPLKLTFLAFGVSALLFLGTFIVMALKIFGVQPPDSHALMFFVLLIGSIQMFMLGFMALYIGATFRESKGRPRYIVKEVLRAPSKNQEK